MYLRIDRMREALTPNCVLSKADINLRPVVKVCEFLTVEKQGRESIVTPGPSTLFNCKLAKPLTQAIAEELHTHRPRPPDV